MDLCRTPVGAPSIGLPRAPDRPPIRAHVGLLAELICQSLCYLQRRLRGSALGGLGPGFYMWCSVVEVAMVGRGGCCVFGPGQ